MKKKVLTMLLAATMVGILATGCGGNQGQTETDSPASQEQKETEDAAEEEQQEPHEPGLELREDGFYSYYDDNSESVKLDYIKTEDEKLYFFNSQGIGAEIDYTYVTDRLVQVFDNTNDSAFIVLGEEKAAVIDGMNGTVDLKKIAPFFTDKPLIVLATHGHGDHIGGIQTFDEVNINDGDFELFNNHSNSNLRFKGLDYGNYIMDTGRDLDYTLLNLEEDMLQKNDDMTLVPIAEGQIFDLGGISIECIIIPGHTEGSTAMLIREDRVLITGDGANKYTQIGSSPVEIFLESMKKLKAREADYDRIFASHGALLDDGTNTAELTATVIDELIEGCEGILDGTNEGVEVAPDAPTRWAYEMGPTGRADGKCGNFMYNTELIYAE